MTEVSGDNTVLPEELAELFGFCWNAELDIRSIKTHLNLHHLRWKSPVMVRKEFWVTMLANNAIRTTALGGAWVCGVHPREISFVICCQFVLAAWECDRHEAWHGTSKILHEPFGADRQVLGGQTSRPV